MAYEALIFGKDGKVKRDLRAIFDRGWLLNGYEECSFSVSVKAETERLEDFAFGNYLVITDDDLPIWGGYFDTPQPWSTKGRVGISAYSGERMFEWRCYTWGMLLAGTPGVVFRKLVRATNTVLPQSTLLRLGEVYEGGNAMNQVINPTKFSDNVQKLLAKSGHDYSVEPVVENGLLAFNANWYARRGSVKDFALEEGVNIQAKDNVVEYQGDIYNYVVAYGNAATWPERVFAYAYNQASIDRYGARMTGLAVDANDPATVQSAANAFVAKNAYPRRTFNLTVGGQRVKEDDKLRTFKNVRIGDVLPLRLYSAPYENGRLGVETKVRVIGMTHRGRTNLMDLTANEVTE